MAAQGGSGPSSFFWCALRPFRCNHCRGPGSAVALGMVNLEACHGSLYDAGPRFRTRTVFVETAEQQFGMIANGSVSRLARPTTEVFTCPKANTVVSLRVAFANSWAIEDASDRDCADAEVAVPEEAQPQRGVRVPSSRTFVRAGRAACWSWCCPWMVSRNTRGVPVDSMSACSVLVRR